MHPLTASPSGSLGGQFTVPGDKSISHRALILGALAVGETRITGLLEGDDVMATAAAMRALGAEIERAADASWRVFGRGVGGLSEPDTVLDMGNSGTAARLLAGVLAGCPFTSFMTGDASMRARPMRRVTEPLGEMGARFTARAGGRLPMAIEGGDPLAPIDYVLPVASAQVKSALLLAGLHAPGITSVTEPRPTRDHSETMLRHFGAEVSIEVAGDGGRRIALTGQPELVGQKVAVPADPSSAAFPLVAALVVPGSEIALPDVGLNPLRGGLVETLREMGAQIEISDRRELAGEPVGTLHIRAGALKGVEVPAERAPAMIDEYPILAVAAAFAEGETVMRGLGELRLKETDRLAAVAGGLEACGVACEAGDDHLAVRGQAGPVPGGGRIETQLDHRIAMSFLVLGLAARAPVTIDDGSPIGTSFPNFVEAMVGLGATIAPGEAVVGGDVGPGR